MRDWRDYDDYGEGKTRRQESADSAHMLGCVFLIVIAAAVVIAAMILLRLWVPMP